MQTLLEMANKSLLAQKGALCLTCVKCTRLGTFPAATQTQARIDAAKAGWRVRLSDQKTICPECK